MEYSNTTHIQILNKVIENIGERRVTSLNTAIARKAQEALKDSLLDIASAHDWEWTKDSILALSWANETAELGETQRIHSVSYGSSSEGYRELVYIDPISFDRRPLLTGYPQFYTYSTYNKVRINPYPNTPEEQSKYRFYVTRELTAPVSETDLIPIPERLLPLLVFRACHYLAVSHLDDAQAAQLWAKQYDILLNKVRARERGQSHRQVNMFRLRG
ncbi:MULTISPECIES: phage adaptor protein [Calothrix]|uniref:Tail tubular protein A n=2 Tax=Calothrix TaxID=1186 RepID=A0ABR8ALI4_9CYAN|nr:MULTISPECIES: hypothetical protein [Calothrix]MBD2200153.1 hypothetical protein [Calothrix parietina FACHB-288]MBD2229137.1 hypothetical protein [Calothrix anomala FACHB-343]